MMKYRALCIFSKEEMEPTPRAREGVFVVAKDQNEYVLLEPYLNHGREYLNFLFDEIGLGDEKDIVARRILFNKGITRFNLTYLGNFFPKESIFEEIHVFTAETVVKYYDRWLYSADLVRVLEYIEEGKICLAESKQAFYRFLNYQKSL